jgi:hypothetical protein
MMECMEVLGTATKYRKVAAAERKDTEKYGLLRQSTIAT